MYRTKRRFVLGNIIESAFALHANANLIVNGGLRDPHTQSQLDADTSAYFDRVCQNGTTVGTATCEAHSESYAMTFGLGGAQDCLSQTFATNAGAQYNLSFFLVNSVYAAFFADLRRFMKPIRPSPASSME